MINNIFHTLQKDLIFLSDPHSVTQDEETIKNKTACAAIRMLGVLGMALSLGAGSRAFLAGRVFGVAAFASSFILAHDSFTVFKNLEESPAKQIGTIVANMFSSAINSALKGENKSTAPRFFVLEGTILRPTWEYLISKNSQE